MFIPITNDKTGQLPAPGLAGFHFYASNLSNKKGKKLILKET